MINYETSLLFFEFSMQNIEFEEQIVQDILHSRFNNNYVTEEVMESKNIIAKIFDKICEFIDKAIMNARSIFSKINLKSSKEKMDKIRKSTSEAKDVKFSLYVPKMELLQPSAIKDISPSAIGFDVDGTSSIKYDYSNQFYKKVMDNKRKGTSISKDEALKFVSKEIIGVEKDKIETVDDLLEKETIEIDKSNCRNNTGVVEKQLDEISKYMNGEFKSCIKELTKLKNDARKFAAATKLLKFNDATGKNVTAVIRAIASFYSKAVNYTVQYLFKSTSMYISCVKKNVDNFEKALM